METHNDRDGEKSTLNRKEKINELKKLLDDNNIYTREHDWFLDRFITLGRQKVQYAYQKLLKYEDFRKKHKATWLIINRRQLRQVFESKCVVVLDGNDKRRRKIVWVRLGKWEPDKHSCDDILQVAGLIAEIHIVIHKFAPLSAVIIFDLDGFGLKHLNALNTKFAKKMVHYLTECAPLEISSIFVLRESKLFSIMYSCFKPFLDDKMKKGIQLFGQDLLALQEHVDVEQLPPELGGTCEHIDPDEWFRMIENDFIRKELLIAGYEFLN